jgi:hypothetical protein
MGKPLGSSGVIRRRLGTQNTCLALIARAGASDVTRDRSLEPSCQRPLHVPFSTREYPHALAGLLISNGEVGCSRVESVGNRVEAVLEEMPVWVDRGLSTATGWVSRGVG